MGTPGRAAEDSPEAEIVRRCRRVARELRPGVCQLLELLEEAGSLRARGSGHRSGLAVIFGEVEGTLREATLSIEAGWVQLDDQLSVSQLARAMRRAARAEARGAAKGASR